MSDKSIPVARRAYRVNEFCRAYGISRAFAYELMSAGRLDFRQHGAFRLIPVDAAERWFNSPSGDIAPVPVAAA